LSIFSGYFFWFGKNSAQKISTKYNKWLCVILQI
jgi:hypothetical protein